MSSLIGMSEKNPDTGLPQGWQDRINALYEKGGAFYAQEVGAENQQPPQYTVTTWPEVGFQLCPKCEGHGLVFKKHATITQPTENCPVCAGKMIINCKTGKPPE